MDTPDIIIETKCWPGLRWPPTLDEIKDHQMRKEHCQDLMKNMPEDERKDFDVLKAWNEYVPYPGYVRPPELSDEEWKERASFMPKKKFYTVDRSKNKGI
jgi:hypothetical protein